MEQRQPVSFSKVTALIAGLFLRRFANRMSSMLRRRAAGPRAGTGRKQTGNPLGIVFLVVAFVFNSVNISGSALRTLAAELGLPRDASGDVEIHPWAYGQLRDFTRGQEPRHLTGAMLSPEDFHRAGHDLQRARVDEFALSSIFAQETDAGNSGSRVDYVYDLIQWYEQKGIQGFVAVPDSPDLSSVWLPQLLAWRDPLLRPLLVHALGLILLILAGARHCWTLGSRNQDLGHIEWSTEWLFTLPASSGTLFGAQILGHAFVDPFAWIGTIPLLLVVYLSTGAGWAVAVPAALMNSIYLSLIMASLRVVSETWLRKNLAPVRLKNFQALFTMVGIVLLFMLFALARSQDVIQWLVQLARTGSPLLIWNPFSLPALPFSLPSLLVAGCEAVAGAGIVLGSIALCSHLVRDGLVTAPAVYTGDRAGVSRRDFLPAGIIGKDLRLLLRDRNFFVQTLVAPALIVCFQIVFNVGMAQSIGSNFHLAATFAFAVGAYVMISTGLNVLAVEGNALWMLYGVPIPLPAIMLRKTMLWSGLGLSYAIVVLAVCGWHIHHFSEIDFSYALFALAGVIIYSFIASGMGMLATDPLEVEVRRRIRPGMIYLYMSLAVLYGYALYSPETWARLGQIVLSSLLAYALWQKVRDRAPFLLDAVSMPAPRVSLADGLIAALAFFVFQGVLSIYFIYLGMLQGRAFLLAFSIAGALVVGVTLLIFWHTRVVGVFSAIGLRGPRDGRRLRAVGIGIALGLGGGFISDCYLYAIRSTPQLEHFVRRAESASFQGGGGWLLPLAVVAAPLFEEFIFRGLVFRGMRRSLPARWSITGSAAVFAVCHPPLSFLPLFIMGALAAFGFELTGWLLTPICVHVTYNSVVLLTGYLRHARF